MLSRRLFSIGDSWMEYEYGALADWYKDRKTEIYYSVTLSTARDTWFIIIIVLLLLLLLTAIEFSVGGSSPYTSTDKINKNNYTYTTQFENTVQTIQNAVYTSTHLTETPTQLSKHPPIHSPTHYKTISNNHSTRYTPNESQYNQAHYSFVHCNYNSVITVRTDDCTRFYKNHINIAEHKLLHVSVLIVPSSGSTHW
jgi:hypothetical protein